MRRLLALTAALTLLLAACGDDSGEDESFDDAPDTTEALPDRVVVFSPEDSETDGFGEPTPWTPGVEDVLAAEELLAEHLEANPDLGVDPLDTYARQYLGVGEDGDLVSVSALCESSLDSLDDWEEEFIVVNDGGSCFWQATLAPSTGQVDPFTVNGNA